MVVPWIGFPLGELIKRFKPTSKAKYVEFTTPVRPEADARPARRGARLALRRGPAHRRGHAPADAAGRRPVRQGAAQPERRAAAAGRALEIRLQGHQVDRQDPLRRSAAAHHLGRRGSSEYGFYANVNPAVDHPRWSQATERRIGANAFGPRQPTLPFNGYAAQVAGLYSGMDLRKYF